MYNSSPTVPGKHAGCIILSPTVPGRHAGCMYYSTVPGRHAGYITGYTTQGGLEAYIPGYTHHPFHCWASLRTSLFLKNVTVMRLS